MIGECVCVVNCTAIELQCEFAMEWMGWGNMKNEMVSCNLHLLRKNLDYIPQSINQLSDLPSEVSSLSSYRQSYLLY